MVTEIQYVNIRRILDECTEHPLMKDLTLEQAVRHTLKFISLHGLSRFYQDKIVDIDIHEFRGLLPCDLISIIQVKDLATHTCLRAMTDSFTPGLVPKPEPPSCGKPHKDLMNNVKPKRELYIPKRKGYTGEPAFKTQGRIIFTSFPEGKVQIAYRAIPVDEDGFPLLIDNETYLACLEAYIKKKVFTVKFDTGKLQAGVLQNAQQEYYTLSAELASEFNTPSPSEMEAYSRMYQTLIPKMREFDNGFRNLGDREYLWKH